MIIKLNIVSVAYKMNFKFLLQVPDNSLRINVNDNSNNEQGSCLWMLMGSKLLQ